MTVSDLDVPVSFRRVVPCRFVGVVMAHVMVMGPNRDECCVGDIGERKGTAE